MRGTAMRSKLLGSAVVICVAAGLVAGCTAERARLAAATGAYCRTTMTALQQVDTGDNQANAFNSSGIVGGFATTSKGVRMPAVWHAPTGKELPVPQGMAGGQAVAVDDHSEVVGVLRDGNRQRHAFFWDGTAMTILKGLPNGVGTFAGGINASGEISGSAVDGNGTYHAVRWTSYQAQPTILTAVPAADDTFGVAINDAGTVGGTTDNLVAGQDVGHPALWTTSHVQKLAGIAGPGSVGDVLAVNAAGQAAGDSALTLKTNDPAFGEHATMWDVSGTVRD